MAGTSTVPRLLKTLGDGTRLRIIRALLDRELCVCELVDGLQLPQYKVSRHLGLLRRLGVVRARRNGTWMYYRVVEKGHLDPFARHLLEGLRGHPPDPAVAAKDEERMRKRLKLRSNGCCVVGFRRP